MCIGRSLFKYFLFCPTFHLFSCKCYLLSHVRLFASPRTVAHQDPLSMGFSRQAYWSGSPFPSPGGRQRLPTPVSWPGKFHGLSLSGKRGGVRRAEWPSCFCCFIKILQLKMSNRPRCHILRQCILNPIIAAGYRSYLFHSCSPWPAQTAGGACWW